MNTFDQIADEVATRLMNNQFGDVGTRLAIMQHAPKDPCKDANDEVYLGGWCRQSVVRVVREVLQEVLR